MKFLLFSDLHLDSAFAWAGRAAGKRREALRRTLTRILNVAVDERVDGILCGGDLYEHERVRPETHAFLRSEFDRVAPLPIYIAPGNHDWIGPASVYVQGDWGPHVHVFRSETLTPVALDDGLTLWGAAHCQPALNRGFLDDFGVDRGGTHIALFHGSELGSFSAFGEGRKAHAPFTEERLIGAGIHHAFLGHYHRPRDAQFHTYPGNPEPLSFGEDGERGVVLVTIAADGQVIRQWRRVACTMFHDLRIDLTGCGNLQDVRDRVHAEVQERSGVARIALSGELVEDVDLGAADWSELSSSLEAPPMIDWSHIRVAYDLNAIAQEPTVRGEFVREVLHSDLPEVTQRRVVSTGLRALDGRDDLEVT